MAVVLWNRSDAETSSAGRGRLLRGGKVWAAERVTQADQGNYTMRDGQGKVLSRCSLTVRGKKRIRRRYKFLLNSGILSSVTFVSIFCFSLLTPIHSFHPAFPFFFFYVHDPACLTRSLLQCDPLHQRVSKPSPFSPHPTCPPHIHPNSIP